MMPKLHGSFLDFAGISTTATIAEAGEVQGSFFVFAASVYCSEELGRVAQGELR